VDVFTTWQIAWGVDAVLVVLGGLYLTGVARHGS
jgi:hypothetical protein